MREDLIELVKAKINDCISCMSNSKEKALRYDIYTGIEEIKKGILDELASIDKMYYRIELECLVNKLFDISDKAKNLSMKTALLAYGKDLESFLITNLNC